VSKEETERLQAEAIAKLKELIRQQDAINAAGPATMGPMQQGAAKEEEDCEDDVPNKGQQQQQVSTTGISGFYVPPLRAQQVRHTEQEVKNSTASSLAFKYDVNS
jgi:hypothetical protein